MLNIFTRSQDTQAETCGEGPCEKQHSAKTVRQITAELEHKLEQLFDLEERLYEDNTIQSDLINSATTRIEDNNVEIQRCIKTRTALAEVFNEMNG